MNNKGIYIILIIFAVLAASSFTYYMMNPLVIDSISNMKELTVTQMEFTTLSDTDVIILLVRNSGKFSVTVDVVKINGEIQNKFTIDSIHGPTFEPGDSGTIIIEHDWITGTKYAVSVFDSDGTLVIGYSDIA